MSSKYKINPCRACEKKLQGTSCNVNTMNDCCYSTLAAFTGATSSNAINNDEAANNCKECVQKVMDGMGVFGRTPCDLKLSAPPLWQQSPHYVPSLLNDGKTPEEARCECIRICRETKYPRECQANCQTDFDAIEARAARKSEKYETTVVNINKNKVSKAPFIIVLTLLMLIFLAITAIIIVRNRV